MKLYYLSSFLVHSIIFAYMVMLPMGQGQGDDHPIIGDIVPKQVEVEVIGNKHESDEAPEIIIPKQKKTEKVLTECKDDRWYGGIGITSSYSTNIVDSVAPGYPAHKAGLRVGDIIERSASPQGSEIRGEPGTTVTLWVKRPSTGEKLVLDIMRDRICLEGKV